MARRWGRGVRDTAPRRVGDAASARGSDGSGSFVRSRTISTYAPGPDLSRLSAHELKRHRLRLVRVLAACVVAVAVLGFVLSQLTAGVGSISYSPAVLSRPDEAAIRQAADDYYATRPLERLRVFLDEKTFGQYLASKLPEIRGVASVSGDGIGSSAVALDMRTPVASWNVGGQKLFVDSAGISFTHDYYAPPTVEVDDQGAAAVSGSTAVASSSTIRYIGQLIAALKEDGTGNVTRVVLPAGMIRELDIYLEGRAYRVKVQLDRDVAGQAADVHVALSYLDAHGGAGEYVDVRVPGKAYYR